MGGLSIWHWIIVLVIVLLVFGTKRLTGGAKDLGNAVKEFKKGMRDEDKDPQQLSDQSQKSTAANSSERTPSSHDDSSST